MGRLKAFATRLFAWKCALIATSVALSLMAREATAASTQQRDEVGPLRQEAERGNANAQFDLGVRYATGKGVAHNDAEAALWIRKAADQGHVQAQFSLGLMYAD